MDNKADEDGDTKPNWDKEDDDDDSV